MSTNAEGAPPSYTPVNTADPDPEVPSDHQQQEAVLLQQPPTQQVVIHVDQNGNPINPQQQQVQVVVVAQQPNQPQISYPNAPSSQVMNGTYSQVPPSEIQSQQNSARANITTSNPSNHTVTNLDEVPPSYDEIISGEYDRKLNATPKDGMGLTAGCTSHKKAWILSILVWILPSLGLILLLAMDNIVAGIILIAIGLQIWCCYSCEWFSSSTRGYLANIYDIEWTYKESERLKQCIPSIQWNVECYHYRRTKDRNGRTERKKVVTHRANMFYQFTSWRDLSIDLTGLEEWKLTKLTIYKQFVFANSMTEQDYMTRMEQFKRNNDRDTHQNFSYTMVLQDFKPKILVEANPGTKKSCMSSGCYYLISCLLCSVCYRTWFSSHTGKKHYIIQKEISYCN